MMLVDREQAVQAKLRELLHICRDFHCLALPMPEVHYVTGVQYAGKAWFREHRIVLSQDFLVKNFDDMIANTVPHELAHLIQYKLFPKAKPHGYIWQSIMIDWFRCNPLRCHSYDTRIEQVDLSDLMP